MRGRAKAVQSPAPASPHVSEKPACSYKALPVTDGSEELPNIIRINTELDASLMPADNPAFRCVSGFLTAIQFRPFQLGFCMSLLLEIQNAAVDSHSDLASLLRRCKVLAARLDSRPLENWLLWEANGYPDEVPLPDYRIWAVQWKGHFSGYFGSALRNAPIPSACLPPDLGEAISHFHCCHSIAAIESLLVDKQNQVMNVSNPHVAVVIGRSLYTDMNCMQAWGEFGAERFADVLNAVRNRVLDFVLALWKEDANAGEIEVGKPKLEAKDVTQIFNTTVYGGGANVVGNATKSHLTVNVTANDPQSLLDQLSQHGISADDLTALKAAITEEPDPTANRKFGPRVAAWIASMVGKAASGAWEMGVGAAGEFLTAAINQYYGIE